MCAVLGALSLQSVAASWTPARLLIGITTAIGATIIAAITTKWYRNGSTKSSCKSSRTAFTNDGTSRDATAAVVVVDPISTGANVADLLLRRGYRVIAITSGQVQQELPTDETLRTDYFSRWHHDSADPSSTLVHLRSLGVPIIGVVCGSELGIECTDFVSHHLGLPSNGIAGSQARRDKYLMQEAVRAAGLLAIRQTRARTWEEVERFAAECPGPLVVKPVRSAGSDHIFKCSSSTDLRHAFDAIVGEKNALGLHNHDVLVQAFIEGAEYIVDTVSRDGVHKVVALWSYDKRSFGGRDFVYFGMQSMSADSPLSGELCAYALHVLDALDIKEGAAHQEIIYTKEGPCLVEVGARPQGCEGTFIPLADRCWGYNQVSALVSATVAPDEFAALPSVCGTERECAYKVDLVSSVAGPLRRIDGLDRIMALPSFFSADLLPRPGALMNVTVDCFTGCGSISLLHRDKEQIRRDVEVIREVEKSMWIV